MNRCAENTPGKDSTLHTDTLKLRLLRGEALMSTGEWIALATSRLRGERVAGRHPLNLLLVQPRTADEALTLLREQGGQDQTPAATKDDRLCLERLIVSVRVYQQGGCLDSGGDRLTLGILTSLLRLGFLARLIHAWTLTDPGELPLLCAALREELDGAALTTTFVHHTEYLEASAPELSHHVLTAMLAAHGDHAHASHEEGWLWAEASEEMSRTLGWLRGSAAWEKHPQRPAVLALARTNLRLKAELEDPC